MIYRAYYDSPIGEIMLAARDGKLIGAWIEGQKYFGGKLKEELANSIDCTEYIIKALLADNTCWAKHFDISQNEFCMKSSDEGCTASQNIDCKVLTDGICWLEEYFAGKRPKTERLPLAPEGSDFAKSVWERLCQIPYGETATYGDIAKEIAALRGVKRVSAQAVGGAVGHNPLSVIVPCHRVIGANGNLTGYAAGIDIKKKLLEHEEVHL